MPTAVGIEKGSSNAKREKVGVLPRDKLRQIAELKMKDLNANTIEAAEEIIAGSARSMGVAVE
jgi:large subunit ribosomal protein L11